MTNIELRKVLIQFPDDYEILLEDWNENFKPPMVLEKQNIDADEETKKIHLGLPDSF